MEMGPNVELFKKLSEKYSLIRLKGKIPKEKGWERYSHERRPFNAIGFRPGENAGIACGPASGILVLDIDDQDKFEKCCSEYGWQVPESLTHKTGSGMLHVVFRYPQNGKKYGNLGRKEFGFDVRGCGGQIVAPGSIHPDTQNPYEVLHDAPLADPPPWLLSLYTADPSKTGTHSGRTGLTARLILQGIKQGERDEKLFKYACRLRGQRMGRQEAEVLVCEAARNCEPPFPEKDALAKVAEAYRKYPEGESQPPPGEDGNGFPRPEKLTEDFIAIQFSRLHSDRLKYCHDRGGWYEWTGTYWRYERTRLAFDWARSLCRKLNADELKISIAKSATASAVEKFAQADRAFAVTSEIWDGDPWLLGTPAGTIDLRTGELLPPRPEDCITKQVLVAPSFQAPTRWLAFLNETTRGDAGLIRFLWQMAGMCLTGSTREHALFFIYGDGGNGKSVFLNALVNILNDYACTASMDTFTASKYERHSTELAMLRGARLVTANETEEGKAWAESRIMDLTGGTPISARFMRRDFFTFLPQFKLIFVGNHQPVLRNVNDAAKRRFNMLPFLFKPAEPDRELESKLHLEYEQILGWMIQGCLDWQKYGLIRPESVMDATDKYFEEQDVFGKWIEEKCEVNVHKGQFETSERLFKSWQEFAIGRGEFPGTAKSFGANMSRKGFVRETKRVDFLDKPAKVWMGISLISPPDRRRDVTD
jgi:putative DNA primase/helicase